MLQAPALAVVGAAWAVLLCLASLTKRLAPSDKVEIELQWWRVDIYVPNSRGTLISSRARQRQLRRWYSLGVVVALLLGVYACWLLAGELVSLSRRLGLLAPPAGAKAAPTQLQLAIPGVTLPASHTLYIWVGVLVSMVLHEAGHALAAAAENVQVGGSGLTFIFLLPAAYVLLDDGDMARLNRWQALRIACAGAWHNAVLSMLCWAGLAVAATAAPLSLPLQLQLLLSYTAGVSAALGLLNMAPVHYLDGEKVLRTLLGSGRPAGLPAVQRQAQGSRTLALDLPAARTAAATWTLHIGTAGLAAVAALHVACLRWCRAS